MAEGDTQKTLDKEAVENINQAILDLITENGTKEQAFIDVINKAQESLRYVAKRFGLTQ